MGRKGYPAEFRRRALDLVAAGKTVAEVARLLEVSDQSIYSVAAAGADRPRRAAGVELGGAGGAARGAAADPGARDRAGGASAGGRAVEGVGAPKRRFEAIAVMAGEGLPVEVACRVLGVSCAGYYAWRFRPPSARAVRHAWLTDVIREVHAASYGSYGANRVHAELVLGRGIRVGHNAVAMLMQRAGIAGRNGARKRRGMPGVADRRGSRRPAVPSRAARTSSG